LTTFPDLFCAVLRPTNKMNLPHWAALLLLLPAEVLSSSLAPLTGFFDVEAAPSIPVSRHVPLFQRSPLRKRSQQHLQEWALREKARVRIKYAPTDTGDLQPLRRRQDWTPTASSGVVNVTNFQADS
jgi:hypothetical protein